MTYMSCHRCTCTLHGQGAETRQEDEHDNSNVISRWQSWRPKAATLEYRLGLAPHNSHIVPRMHSSTISTLATATMAAMNKIAPNSPSRHKPSELESSIANALYDLESNIPDMKSALRPLQFVSAREVCLPFSWPQQQSGSYFPEKHKILSLMGVAEQSYSHELLKSQPGTIFRLTAETASHF